MALVSMVGGASPESQHIMAHKMKIYIRTTYGELIILDTKPDDTIETLKLMIEKEKGCHPSEQLLLFSGKVLDDRCTLRDYNIQRESTIHLIIVKHFYVWVNTSSGRRSYKVNQVMSVDDVIEKVANEDDFATSEGLVLMLDGKELDKSLTLQYYKIQANCTLTLGRKDQIMVTMLTKEKFPFVIQPALDTVEGIKKKICWQTGIPATHQKLMLKTHELLNGNTLEACGVHDGDDLALHFSCPNNEGKLNLKFSQYRYIDHYDIWQDGCA